MVSAVKCIQCNKLHEVDSPTYFKFSGNLYVGDNGGLIGNNLDVDGKVERESIICVECFISYLINSEIISAYTLYRMVQKEGY